MLISHHRLRGFVKLVLWDVYCVNGYGSFRLGYVGVGFGGNCDCRYGILYAPMLGGGWGLRVWLLVILCTLSEVKVPTKRENRPGLALTMLGISASKRHVQTNPSGSCPGA